VCLYEISLELFFCSANGTRNAYNGNQAARYTPNSQTVPANITMQYDSQFGGPSVQTQTSRTSNMLALGPPQQQHQNFEFPELSQSMQLTGMNPFDAWAQPHENRGGVDDYLMEEIRMRSHEILENDEMQQMLRFLNTGGASTNLTEDAFNFPSYTPAPSPSMAFEDGCSRTPGRAVVGWLKIKAAMRWGIFVRKKAAERRAQLVELDD
jgi:hypothetical protein